MITNKLIHGKLPIFPLEPLLPKMCKFRNLFSSLLSSLARFSPGFPKELDTPNLVCLVQEAGHMGVSLNGGFSPKSSILIGFSSIFTIHFGVSLFLETPICCGLQHWDYQFRAPQVPCSLFLSVCIS